MVITRSQTIYEVSVTHKTNMKILDSDKLRNHTKHVQETIIILQDEKKKLETDISNLQKIHSDTKDSKNDESCANCLTSGSDVWI